MLNQLDENQLDGNDCYFPEEGKFFAFGVYEITTLATMSDDFKFYRKLMVKKDLKNSLTIDHYQIHSWKD